MLGMLNPQSAPLSAPAAVASQKNGLKPANGMNLGRGGNVQ
jgi:hypothetical protein